MEKLSLKINMEECYELTHRLFMDMSGINKKGEKFERMKRDAHKIRKQIENRINISIVCNYYEDITLKEKKLKIDNQVFTCNAFEQINKNSVKGAYVYALTAGEFDSKDQPIMDRLYADIWGTSFTDAARILLKKELDKRGLVSDSFGPGFYGMDLNEMGKIDRLVDFEKLGIELRNEKILVPVKSCAGIYMNVTNEYKRLDKSCVDCRGSIKSCQLCRQGEIMEASY